MLLGQFQARLVGHPPSSSTTSAIDLRQGHLLELGAICHRLRKFAGAGLNSQSASTGQYNRAFCRELGAILSEYSRDVLDLGSLPDREVPISELEVKLSRHASVMPALDRLVAERAESEDNGPALLNVLHRASFCGDDDIQRAITRLQKACHGVLFHYIAAWTVYGRLVDNGNEFFIRPAYSTTGQQEDVSLEEALIPDYLGLPVCRQILFIGKACRLFAQSGGDQRWRDDTRLLSARLVALARVDRFDLRAVEETIHATHRSLTSHFSRWLLHHADLPAHLTVLRDFYLFGRGELYNRFLEQARPLLCKPPDRRFRTRGGKAVARGAGGHGRGRRGATQEGESTRRRPPHPSAVQEQPVGPSRLGRAEAELRVQVERGLVDSLQRRHHREIQRVVPISAATAPRADGPRARVGRAEAVAAPPVGGGGCQGEGYFESSGGGQDRRAARLPAAARDVLLRRRPPPLHPGRDRGGVWGDVREPGRRGGQGRDRRGGGGGPARGLPPQARRLLRLLQHSLHPRLPHPNLCSLPSVCRLRDVGRTAIGRACVDAGRVPAGVPQAPHLRGGRAHGPPGPEGPVRLRPPLLRPPPPLPKLFLHHLFLLPFPLLTSLLHPFVQKTHTNDPTIL